MLRQAWDDCTSDADLLLDAITARLNTAREIQEDDLNSSSSNSHTGTSNAPGENTFTAAENVRGWSQIEMGFRVARQFLQDCADYALDAFQIKHSQIFPKPLPTVANPAITVDATGRWLRLARFYDVDSAKIVGQIVGDEAVYCWMLDNSDLLNIDHGVMESRGDYSGGIIGRTGGVLYA
jgi:hypothetical protein